MTYECRWWGKNQHKYKHSQHGETIFLKGRWMKSLSKGWLEKGWIESKNAEKKIEKVNCFIIRRTERVNESESCKHWRIVMD